MTMGIDIYQVVVKNAYLVLGAEWQSLFFLILKTLLLPRISADHIEPVSEDFYDAIKF